MATARKEEIERVLSDLWNDLKSKKCTALIAFVISLIPLIILLLNYKSDYMCQINLIDKLFNVNLALLSINITALAILFALFQGEKLTEVAKEAFKEQSISFIGNAIMQLIAIIVSIIYFICFSNSIIYISTVFLLQMWAILLVFDIIVELYTLITAIKNKH